MAVLGNKQEYGVDYEETFALVAKMTTVRMVFSIATSHGWPLHQMDVKNAFLHDDLKEDIYMVLPPGLSSPSSSDVCKLKRSLYELKQAPRHGLINSDQPCFAFLLSRANMTHFCFSAKQLLVLLFSWFMLMILSLLG